jgi:hypothetical protein
MSKLSHGLRHVESQAVDRRSFAGWRLGLSETTQRVMAASSLGGSLTLLDAPDDSESDSRGELTSSDTVAPPRKQRLSLSRLAERAAVRDRRASPLSSRRTTRPRWTSDSNFATLPFQGLFVVQACCTADLERILDRSSPKIKAPPERGFPQSG